MKSVISSQGVVTKPASKTTNCHLYKYLTVLSYFNNLQPLKSTIY